MERAKGILYAALSSSTFGLAPLFTLLLLGLGYSSFEVLSYRWGVASLFLGALALLAGRSFRLSYRIKKRQSYETIVYKTIEFVLIRLTTGHQIVAK